MSKKPDILVFGLSGYVGQVFQKQLGTEFNLINLSLETGVDITSLPSVREAILRSTSPLAVVNLAAATDTGRAWSDPSYQTLSQQVNSVGAENVATVCEEKRLFGVHVSTDYVYSGRKKAPYTESDPLDPIEPYGQTKAVGEVAALSHGMTVATLAFPYTDKPSRPDAVARIVDQLRTGPVKAFSDQFITPTLVEDFALATRQLILRKSQGKYFVVGSSVETPYSLRVKIAQRIGVDSSQVVPTSVVEYNQMAAEKGLRPFQPNLHLLNDKTIAITGVPIKTFDAGINFLTR